jgi:mono/diheme cytochrome c family protein
VAIALLAVSSALAQADAKRGAYLAKAAGCVGCHTEDKQGATPYAGGRVLDTPFGRFYGPNITPHPTAGIGRWSEQDFRRALRSGLRPDGAHFYPAFPYPSFTRITDADLRDLWAYLRTLAPSDRKNQAHELRFPYGWRPLVGAWKLLYFEPGAHAGMQGRSSAVARGAYLANALGHCGECHTPRNALGGVRKERHLAGGESPEGKRIPNLTPVGLKKWSDGELEDFLVTGLTPDGDIAARAMGEVIRNSTSQLTPKDLAALVAYLRSLPPIADEGR